MASTLEVTPSKAYSLVQLVTKPLLSLPGVTYRALASNHNFLGLLLKRKSVQISNSDARADSYCTSSVVSGPIIPLSESDVFETVHIDRK
jgi:hypothetical protein